MSWQCVECVRADMDVVCHHCGKPLCREDAYELMDGALSDADAAAPPALAMHCKECWQRHHPGVNVVYEQQVSA